MAAPESPEYMEEGTGGELPDEEQSQAQRGPSDQRVEFHFCREWYVVHVSLLSTLLYLPFLRCYLKTVSMAF
jgi:hypothetical protein